MLQKLKFFVLDDTVYISLLIIMVALVSFNLGRVLNSKETNLGVNTAQKGQLVLKSSNFEGKVATSTVETTPVTIPDREPTDLKPALSSSEFNASVTSTTTIDYKYVASKSGTRYHLFKCPGAKNIKETNKVYFRTTQEAESSGYTKASNCPGL